MMITIKKFRKNMGLTQNDFAKKLSVAQSTVAMWESGNNVPRADKLIEIAKIFGCSIDELLNEKSEKTA